MLPIRSRPEVVPMRVRAVIAALAAGLVLAACGGSDEPEQQGGIPAPDPTAAGTLVVWLMDGSQPQTVVDEVNERFAEAYPDVDVEVQLQQWAGIQDLLSTTLGTDAGPDVVEIGNTLTARYADAGLLADLSSARDDLDLDSMLPGAVATGELDGRRYGVPYYGGVDVVVYRKSHFERADVTVPASLADLERAAEALQERADDEAYSAFYFPGTYAEGALPFVWAHGGDVATRSDGTWTGALDSAEARRGLAQLQALVQAHSRAPKDGDLEGNLEAFRSGDVGMMMDSWWVPGALDRDELQGDIGAFPLPGVEADSLAPVHFGGSDLAVSARSRQPGLAVEWIRILTGEPVQTMLANAGVIPNQEGAFAGHANNPYLKVADRAALVSRSTPVSPLWPNVVSARVLEDMLVDVITGEATVDEATSRASATITDVLAG